MSALDGPQSIKSRNASFYRPRHLSNKGWMSSTEFDGHSFNRYASREVDVMFSYAAASQETKAGSALAAPLGTK